MKPAVVLVSGGVDSAIVLWMVIRDGFEPHAITFDYGQRNFQEIGAAHDVVRASGFGLNHVQLRLPLDLIGGSPLTSESLPVPKNRSYEQITQHMSPTYVPACGLVFLSMAVAWAENLGCSDIFVGGTGEDRLAYPYYRTNFHAAFSYLARLGTKAGKLGCDFRIHAPLLYIRKKNAVKIGREMKVPLDLTFSCFDPQDNLPCNACDACLLRNDSFKEDLCHTSTNLLTSPLA